MKNMSTFVVFKPHCLMAAAWRMLLLLIPTLGKLRSPFVKCTFGFCTTVHM